MAVVVTVPPESEARAVDDAHDAVDGEPDEVVVPVGPVGVVEDPDDLAGRVEERCARRGRHAPGPDADRGHRGGDGGHAARPDRW